MSVVLTAGWLVAREQKRLGESGGRGGMPVRGAARLSEAGKLLRVAGEPLFTEAGAMLQAVVAGRARVCPAGPTPVLRRTEQRRVMRIGDRHPGCLARRIAVDWRGGHAHVGPINGLLLRSAAPDA